jgi:hypothetical protein
MEPFDCYKIYLSLKLHFTKDYYDYFKHHRTKASLKSFLKRNDYYYFVKLSNTYNAEELIDFFVSQLIVDKEFWIGDSFSDTNHIHYTEFLQCKHSMSRRLEQDLTYLYNTFTDVELFTPTRGYPRFISSYLGGKIRLETLVLLDTYISWSTKINLLDGIVWVPLRFLINKYRPFLNWYDMDKFKDIYDNVLANKLNC